jgi:uncharacterized protein YoxC
MKLASEMKNLSEEVLASFKQRIKENEEIARRNEELVNEVQKTLDGFRKDHQGMAAVLNANAVALRKGLANGEKERLNTYNELMDGIHGTIASIQKGVMTIQTSTSDLINEFTASRAQMAVDLGKFFAQNRDGLEQNEKIRMQDEKTRMKEFDAMMNNINNDLKSINNEVLGIFKSTNDMLEKFEKEHQEMSAELRAELSKNLSERVTYTKSLLLEFQKRLSEIGNENQELAKKMRKELANSQKQIAKGEVERLNEYKAVMNGIHAAIKGIRKDVNDIQKSTSAMIGDYSQDRSQAAAAWNKMQETIAQLKEKGFVVPPKVVVKKEAKKEAPVKKDKETPVEAKPDEKVIETPVAETAQKDREAPVKAPEQVVPMTLEEKILDYINKHPGGVRISEMEEPLGEARMKLGFIAKNLLDSGKVQKIDTVYFPLKK